MHGMTDREVSEADYIKLFNAIRSLCYVLHTLLERIIDNKYPWFAMYYRTGIDYVLFYEIDSAKWIIYHHGRWCNDIIFCCTRLPQSLVLEGKKQIYATLNDDRWLELILRCFIGFSVQDTLPVKELLLRDPVCTAPCGLGHPAVHTFIQNLSPMLYTDLMRDFIYGDNSFKKLVVFWSYYLMERGNWHGTTDLPCT